MIDEILQALESATKKLLMGIDPLIVWDDYFVNENKCISLKK
jgi:hypothetical protein